MDQDYASYFRQQAEAIRQAMQPRQQAATETLPTTVAESLGFSPVSYNPSLGMQEKGYSPFGEMSYRIGKTFVPPPQLSETPTDEEMAAYNAWMEGTPSQATNDALAKALAIRDASKVYQQLGQYQDKGLNFANKGLSSEQNRETIAARLAEYGIDDLSKIGAFTAADGSTKFYNRETGKELPKRVGYTTWGEGMQNYNLVQLPNGTVIPTADWEDTSDNAKIAQAAAIAAALAAPLALPALGAATGLGAAASGALYGAGTGAIGSGLAGGDIGKGALTGAVAGGIGGGLAGYNPAGSMGITSPVANSAIRGGLTSAVGAGMNGGNVLNAALTGAAAGGVGGGLTQYLGGSAPTFGDRALGSLAGRTVAQQLAQALATKTSTGGLSQVSQASTPPDLSALPQYIQDRLTTAMRATGRA